MNKEQKHVMASHTVQRPCTVYVLVVPLVVYATLQIGAFSNVVEYLEPPGGVHLLMSTTDEGAASLLNLDLQVY